MTILLKALILFLFSATAFAADLVSPNAPLSLSVDGSTIPDSPPPIPEVKTGLLVDVAKSMSEGQNKFVQMQSTLTPSTIKPTAISITAWSSRMMYHPNRQKIYFWGRAHGQPCFSVEYDITTNKWDKDTFPIPPHCNHHYDHGAIDVDNDTMFVRTKGAFPDEDPTKTFYKMNLSTKKWESFPYDYTKEYNSSLTWFPDINGLVFNDGNHNNFSSITNYLGDWNPAVSYKAFYNPTAVKGDPDYLGSVERATYHNTAVYLKRKNVIVFGGGNSGSRRDIFEMFSANTDIASTNDAARNSSIRRLHDAPEKFGNGKRQGLFFANPGNTGGDIILLAHNGNIYEYFYDLDRWSAPIGTHNIVKEDDTVAVWPTATALPDLGVTMIYTDKKDSAGNMKILLYKR